MNKAMRKSLTAGEESLIEETKPKNLASLSEDELLALHKRVRRARSKYVKSLRRQGSASVGESGGRNAKGSKYTRFAVKAEVFEDALARVSKQLAVASRASANELRDARLAAAQAGRSSGPDSAADSPGGAAAGKSGARGKSASKKTPASKKRNASTKSAGARRQAKRDSR